MSLSREDRFWSKVEKSDGCWEWQGCTVRGYGQFGIGRKMIQAHRVSYEMAHGPIPRTMLVCHVCDNRACVRPDHLFLGSYKDNYEDARAKGRNTRGEMVGASKLTEAQVAEIKSLLEQGHTKTAIGERFGVTRTAIYWIAVGRNWDRAVERGDTEEAA
jgi:hypothetical protein